MSIISQLQHLDEVAFSSLNGWHCGYADGVMWLMTGKWAYVLMVLAFVYIACRKGWEQFALLVLAVALTITLSDQISSSIIKPLVCRFRPSHTEHLMAYVLNDYRGGMYGFVSSHAANSFGVAMLVTLLFRNRMVGLTMTIWAVIVSYTRIYLGVHYPGDIMCGGIIGMAMAALVNKIIRILASRLHIDLLFSEKETKILCYSVITNIAVILIVAIFYKI